MKKSIVFINIFLLFYVGTTWANESIHCTEKDIDTYFGTVDLDLVFKYPNKMYSSVITLESGGKTVKIIKQTSYARWENLGGVVFFSQGDAIDATTSNEQIISNSQTTFTITKPPYAKAYIFKFDLKDHSGAIDIATKNCVIQ